MPFTERELWTIIHGMGLGALFLLAFAGGFAGLYSFRPGLLTAQGIQERVPRLNVGTWVMAIVAWLTCITGTFIVYPWYRAAPPTGLKELAAFPRYFLLANPQLAFWHTFGMEWKEHVAWLAPMIATSIAFIVWHYRSYLMQNDFLRKAVLWFFVLAFSAAAIAGALGAFITKAAPLL